MRCSEIIERLELLAPASYACDWDNPGLLAGRMEKDVKNVLVALDVTDAVVEQALSRQVDMLITHHPLIFGSIKKVNDQDLTGRRLIKLIQADISYYAMHTNFDVAPGCMADLAAERLGIRPEGPLESTGEAEGKPIGIGKIGTLMSPVMLEEMGALVKERFDLPFVTVYGLGQVKEPITRIGISPGAGNSMIAHGLAAGVQVLITGDIGHHSGIDAVGGGMAVIDAGHYGLEHIFVEYMVHYLQKQFGEVIQVTQADPEFPAGVIC